MIYRSGLAHGVPGENHLAWQFEIGNGTADSTHFQTQLSDGSIVVESYYNLNNFGFGTYMKFPPRPPEGYAGFGPGYATPGLPHRTGHGIGLDVHEWPYLVKGDRTILRPSMTFSNEPTICIYGEFGVRLEDHMVITETGARWFTEPAHSVDDPFGLEK